MHLKRRRVLLVAESQCETGERREVPQKIILKSSRAVFLQLKRESGLQRRQPLLHLEHLCVKSY